VALTTPFAQTGAFSPGAKGPEFIDPPYTRLIGDL
jgi:hypothetical protein